MINFHPPKLQMAGPEIFEALFGNLGLIWRGKESSVQGTEWGEGKLNSFSLFYIIASLNITWKGEGWNLCLSLMDKNKQTNTQKRKQNKKQKIYFRNWFKTNDGKGSENIANCEFFSCFNYLIILLLKTWWVVKVFNYGV